MPTFRKGKNKKLQNLSHVPEIKGCFVECLDRLVRFHRCRGSVHGHGNSAHPMNKYIICFETRQIEMRRHTDRLLVMVVRVRTSNYTRHAASRKGSEAKPQMAVKWRLQFVATEKCLYDRPRCIKSCIFKRNQRIVQSRELFLHHLNHHSSMLHSVFIAS